MPVLLHNNRVDVLNLKEVNGVGRRMTTKARITGLTSLDHTVLLQAYATVGLPAVGVSFITNTEAEFAIFGQLILAERDFAVVNEDPGAVDVTMEWQHFMDNHNQPIGVKGAPDAMFGNATIFGKSRTSVQQTKVNFFYSKPHNIRKWPNVGQEMPVLDASVDPFGEVSINNGFGADRPRVGGFVNADFQANDVDGNPRTVFDLRRLRGCCNCIEYNGFIWFAKRQIWWKQDGGVIFAEGTGQPIRPDPPPGPNPLMGPPDNPTMWPPDDPNRPGPRGDPYRDPLTGDIYNFTLYPGDPTARSKEFGPGVPNPGDGAVFDMGWPWRVARPEDEGFAFLGDLNEEQGEGPFVFPDYYLAKEGDLIRRPIAVGHRFALNDRTLARQTFYQTGEVSIMDPHANYTVKGIIGTSDPQWIEDQIVGKTNLVAWRNGEPGQWMCTEAQSEAIITNRRYQFSFEFQRNRDGWDPTAVFNDQRTGRPPPNLTPRFGTVVVPWHTRLDFDEFFSATFEK